MVVDSKVVIIGSHNWTNQGAVANRDASLVIGMRGHATMVPFCLGTPVLSIVSHPKMRYFLEDIGRLYWAFDAATPDLGERLLESTLDIVARE